MLTRCPQPLCRKTFAVPEGSLPAAGQCPHCGQLMTFRALEIIDQVERLALKRASFKADRGAIAAPPAGSTRFSALLEDVRSLWNVGSMFRTADGAGFSMLYLCGITGCPPRKEIAKTSLGAEENVAWEYKSAALEVLSDLKQAGVLLLGLEFVKGSEYLPDSQPLKEALAKNSIAAPVCLCVGNEVSGLSAELLSQCDLVCHLPMRGVKESLNVAVAFGIAAYMLSVAL